MGTKYSSQSVSAYNASAPSDDGSTASTNQVKWATIKTKLSDPLNSFASAVNSALVTAFDYSMRSVTSADSTVAGDHMRTLQVPSTVTTTFTISLGDAATMANGYIVRIRNSGQIGITIGRATAGDTLDGAASNKLLPPGATGIYAVNASANGYVTLSYAGPVQDTDAIVAGGTDGTKKVRLEVDGLTTGTTRVLTVPDFDGTIATLAGTEIITNKTLTSPTINTAAAGGAWTAASTWTLPAFTLGGAVTGNGQNISGIGTLSATGAAEIAGASAATLGGNFAVNVEAGANLSVRTFSGIGGVGTGIGLDALNDAASSVVTFGIRGSSIVFRGASGESGRWDTSGNLLVGTTSVQQNSILSVVSDATHNTIAAKTAGGAGVWPLELWSTATVDDNSFAVFGTEGAFTTRGSIDYNRAGGAVRYNTSSDGTLKNKFGPAPVAVSKDLVLASPISEYAWRDDPTQKKQIGPIAQELYESGFTGAVKVGGMRDVMEDIKEDVFEDVEEDVFEDLIGDITEPVYEDAFNAEGAKIGVIQTGTQVVGQGVVGRVKTGTQIVSKKVGERVIGQQKVGEKYEPWGVDKTAFTFHLVVCVQDLYAQLGALRADFDAYKAAHP